MSPNDHLETIILTRANFGLLVLFVAVYVWREVRQLNSKGNLMSDFGKKLLAFGIVAALMFGVLAAITWFKVNQYDEGEFTMNTLQGIASAVVLVFMAQLKNVFGVVVLTASLLTASVADAGLFNLFTRARSSSSACANGQCGIKAIKPMPLPAASGTAKPVKPLAPKPLAPKAK